MGLRIVSEPTFEPVPAKASVPSSHQWANQQLDIFEWFRSGTGNLVVRARAGTGKTTTLCEGVTQAPEDNILVTSFGNRVVRELTSRLTDVPAVLVKSLHGVGLQAISSVVRNVKVDSEGARAANLTAQVCSPKIYDSVRRMITKCHTKARESYPYLSDVDELTKLAILWECVPDGTAPELIGDRALAAMKKALEPTTTVDFADMIYLPLVKGYARGRFPLVVVDEGQDMSPPQLDLAQAVLLPGGRMCIVGDDRQGIYAFRGADTGALDRLKHELDAVELPLTVTYRCGKSIVREAQTLVADIEAHDASPDGEVVNGLLMDDMLAMVEPKDFILSRLNAPLVRIALNLISQGRRTKIEGRDIGKSLIALSRRFSRYGKVNDIHVWLANMVEWRNRQIVLATQQDLQSRIDMITDQCACMWVIADACDTVAGIEKRIQEMFDDTYGAGDFIICSSVHRAKGLEADRVFVLRDTLYLRVACVCGHRHPRNSGSCKRCNCTDYRENPIAAREEENIAYVAMTRAKRLLVWVKGELGV